MSIKVEHLTKRYGNRKLFHSFSFTFKENRLYTIVGESGCGKTTLLNILSLLDSNYEGNVFFDNLSYKTLNPTEKDSIRFENFSFIFQNFNLLENDTVETNIRVIFDSLINEKEDIKKERIKEIIKELSIESILHSKAKNLSGGEKQRVAIARALICNPKVIFCDEPTGSLDAKNSENVFNLFKIASKFTTVICVTHDYSYAKKYSDEIINIEKNGKIIIEKNENNKTIILDTKLKDIKLKRKRKSLTYKFIFSHIKNNLKSHKFRNVFKSLLYIICLICCGLSISLTTSLKSSIYNSFNNVIDDNSIVMTKKNSLNRILDSYSASEHKVLNVINKYKTYVDYYGERYLYNFEENFLDENTLYDINGAYRVKLNGFSARTFNEFIYLDRSEELDMYPKYEDYLNDDEVILSITFDQMKQICLNLKILRDFDTLSRYIQEHDYFVSLNLANKNWTYSDEQLFRVKAFIFSTKNRVYHSNPHFAYNLFEEKMRFPVSYNLNKNNHYPWYFKKIYFLHTKKYQDSFLNMIFYDNEYSDLIFDIDSDSYSPLTYGNFGENTNRIFVFESFKDYIDISVVKAIKDLDFGFEDYYFSSDSGYRNNGTSLFTGFSKPAFFSLSEDLNNSIIDAHSKVSQNEFYNIKVPENVVDGFSLNPNSHKVRFDIYNKSISLKEIAISRGFARILSKDNDLMNKDLYASLMVKSVYNGKAITNKFNTCKLKIVDIVDDDSVAIYHNRDYSISLFRDLFKVSSFELIPTSVIFKSNSRIDEKKVTMLNNIFKEYEFKNPLFEIEKSIDESTRFLKYLLYVFSITTLISSLILSILISVVSIIESKREYGLLRIMGFKKSEVLKLNFVEMSCQLFVCLLTSFLTIGLINLVVSNKLSASLSISSMNLFSVESSIFMIIVSAVIILVGLIASNQELKGIKLVESVH